MENISFESNNFCLPCHDIISLTEDHTRSWPEIAALSALMPRGWFELAQLSCADRIEFVSLFWLSKLAYPDEKESVVRRGIGHFFDSLATIELFLVKNRESSPYLPLMLYCQKDGTTFFGKIAATTPLTLRTAQQFNHIPLPEDYLSFFTIHDGFQSSHEGGIIPLRDLFSCYQRFKERSFFEKKEGMIFPFCELAQVHQLYSFSRSEQEAAPRILYIDGLEGKAEKNKKIFDSFSEWLVDYVHCK